MLGIGHAVAIAIGTAVAMAVNGAVPDAPCTGCAVANTTTTCATLQWVTSSTGSCASCSTYVVRIRGSACADGQCKEPGNCSQDYGCQNALEVEYMASCVVTVTIADSGSGCCGLGCANTYPNLPVRTTWWPVATLATNTDCGVTCSITATIFPTNGDCTPVAATWSYDCTACT